MSENERPSMVQQFYDEYDEWDRLRRHKFEFWSTVRAFDDYIEPQSDIVDVGGGPGRYSIHLAGQGHRVWLLDLSESCISVAKQKARQRGVTLQLARQADARELPLPDEKFDVVLLMGPLYHLIDCQDRKQAVREALRILRPGGLLFSAFITRFAFVIDLLRRGPEGLIELPEGFQHTLETGISKPETNEGSPEAYFIDPLAVKPWLEGLGLKTLRLFSPDAFIGPAEPEIYQLPPEVQQAWLDFSYRWGAEPSGWCMGEHLLHVGKKPLDCERE